MAGKQARRNVTRVDVFSWPAIGLRLELIGTDGRCQRYCFESCDNDLGKREIEGQDCAAFAGANGWPQHRRELPGRPTPSVSLDRVPTGDQLETCARIGHSYFGCQRWCGF